MGSPEALPVPRKWSLDGRRVLPLLSISLRLSEFQRILLLKLQSTSMSRPIGGGMRNTGFLFTGVYIPFLHGET
jgi:hypothetical protein